MINEHIGELHPTNDGLYQYKIIDWVDNTKVTVELQKPYQPGEEPYRRTTTYQRIRKGLGYPGMIIKKSPNLYAINKNQEFKEEWEGKIFPTCEGAGQYQIVNYINAHDIIIHFLGTLCYQHRDLIAIKRNQVQYPFLCNKPGYTNPVYFADPYKKYMGSYFLTTEGRKQVSLGLFPDPSEIYRVIGYDTKNHITVQFQDEYGYTCVSSSNDICNGAVRNRYKINLKDNKGILPALTEVQAYELIFNKWRGMRDRVRSNPAYANTEICEEWKEFNNFKRWYMSEVGKLNQKYLTEYNIDKDLKYPYYCQYTNGKKLYGPDTVVIIPTELNVRIKNINSKEKSDVIIDCAKFYLSENAITQEVYDMIVDQIGRL